MKTWALHREDLMTREEWLKLRSHLQAKYDLAVARDTWTAVQDLVICFTAIYTGLRRMELAGLRLGDLHLTNENPFIVVRHGKGDKFREVVISPSTRAMLKSFLRSQHVTPEDAPDRFLFVPQRGEHYTPDGIYRVWKTACREAGIREVSIHKARHLYCTTLYAVKKDARFVQRQAGHTRLTTTQVYIDITDVDANENLVLLDKALTQRPTVHESVGGAGCRTA